MILLILVSVKSTKDPDDNEQIIVNMYYNEEYQNFSLNESKSKDENSIAYAIYNKSYERTGWDFLAISTYDKNDSRYTDSNKAYAMGYLEGYLTKDKIYSYYNNMIHYYYYYNNLSIPQKIKNFFRTNIKYMKEKSERYKNNEIYWEHVYYIYRQLEGLYDGYVSSIEEDKKLDFYEFILLPGIGDLSDIMTKLYMENITNFEDMKIEEFKSFFYHIHIVLH